MKTTTMFRSCLTFLLIFAMLSPMAVMAIGDGKKHFRKGLDEEAAEAWDLAAEEFALAVNENPKNPEYRLHLQRALFNASQMFVKKGTAAAKEKDYEGAYNAFRRAYAYDPTNELAKSEMERMVRLQAGDKTAAADSAGNVKLVPTSYKAQQPIPQKLQTLRDVPFPGGVDLQFLIKELAKDLDLNVLFDSGSNSLRNRQVKIDLHNVSAAQALDYIFLQENLFFQKVGPRTILVADNTRRANFQQLVLRTFYLANADPTKIKPLIQQAIPPQPGRSQTIVMEDAATNSITIRDTEENIRLIGSLINSLDKDRAEVVMDVGIYEVNKTDLMQFGNQLPVAQLSNLGGTATPIIHAGTTQAITQNMASAVIGSSAIAFGLPITQFNALQTRGNTRLLASTQIHAFNNEDSSATIGQRVPVQTAQVQTGNAVGGGGIVSDIINYEQTGLTLKFKPLVFPNQDVQVAMEITSKDVASGGTDKNPIFTERTIKGTARVQNNKTLLLASVASHTESTGQSSLPFIGLIPILGRLFSAPTHKNDQIDIVIAITPRVIRAPAILPEDEIERPTGSQGTPTNSSLVAMLMQDELDEQVAAARQNPTNSAVQLPDQPATPEYVRTSSTQTDPKNDSSAANTATVAAPTNDAAAVSKPGPIDASLVKPIDTSAKTLDIKRTSDTSVQSTVSQVPADQPRATLLPVDDATMTAAKTLKAGLRLGADVPDMKKGDKVKVPIYVDASDVFRTATFGLAFDSSKVAVRSVRFGDIFGAKLASTESMPYLNQDGKMYVSLASPGASVDGATGILAYVEIEALADGKPVLTFDKNVLSMQTEKGKNFVINF